jgi:hypothetical protein
VLSLDNNALPWYDDKCCNTAAAYLNYTVSLQIINAIGQFLKKFILLSASIPQYGDVWDPEKCPAMLTQPFEKHAWQYSTGSFLAIKKSQPIAR